MGIKLSKLNQAIHLKTKKDYDLNKMSDDSREVQKNDLYVCTIQNQKAMTYIQQALNKGAIVYGLINYYHERYYQIQEKDYKTIIQTFYTFDLSKMIIIGICGTNGKTSIVTMIYHHLKEDAMLISTHHIYCKKEHFLQRNTTPNCFVLAKYIQYAYEQNCHYIIMEVSSHAIDQQRILFLQYDYILYSNITSDHLDYHLCQTHYILTKLKLRNYLKKDGWIICYDDLPYVQLCSKQCKILKHITHVKHHPDGYHFQWNKEEYQIPYHTLFHVDNAFLVLQLFQHLKLSHIKEKMKQLPPIKGRCEMHYLKDIPIMIDYAHSEDGLYQLLTNVKGYQRMICVIGCGGNRDQRKRKKMGEIACQYSHMAIYTSDNPRYEKISDIILMMMEHDYQNYHVIENRYCAIKYAVKYAQKGDIIIIAGKGDETTQEIQGVFYPFSDEQCIKRIESEEETWK